MARFAARYGAYSVGVREEVAEVFAQGKRVIVKGLEAQFERARLSDFERETALQSLRFHGLPEDRETRTDVSPLSRIGVFDSEKAKRELRWSDEDHELVLEALRNDPQFNIDFIELAVQKRPAPWGGYDKLESAEKIAELVLDTETPVADVIAYELENQNRPEVIAVLEELLEPAGEPEIVIEA